MGFEVLPAIDVSGGRLAVSTARGPEPVEAYGGDPVAAARAYVDAGATWLHVVDLDHAFLGEPRNLGVVTTITELGPSVQGSGGLRTADDVQEMLDAGARRAVLGSGALGDEAHAQESIRRFAGRLVVGIEVDEGRIRSRGLHRVDLPISETLGWLVAAGAHAFLATDVRRVGTLDGPLLPAPTYNRAPAD